MSVSKIASKMPSIVDGSTAEAAVQARPRTWVRQIIGGGQTVETCPEWCTLSHQYDGRGNLDDLTHAGDSVGAEVPLFDEWVDGEPVLVQVPVLAAQIRVDPYSENPQRNRPFVTFELTDQDMLDGLSPDEFAAYIAQIRAHCDQLDAVHARLAQAIAEHEGTPAA